MHYELTAYSRIDRSIRWVKRFDTEIEANVTKLKLEDEVANDLCYMGIETVYEE